MSQTSQDAARSAATSMSSGRRRDRWLAGGGVIGGLLASACCVLPLALFSLGIGGAWIGQLTALAPYKPWFWAAGALFVAAGFVSAWRGRRACRINGGCPPPRWQRVTQALLGFAAVLLMLVAVWPWILPVLMEG